MPASARASARASSTRSLMPASRATKIPFVGRSVSIFDLLGDRYRSARAHFELGRAYAIAQPERAAEHLTRAVNIAFGFAIAGPIVGWTGMYLVLGVGLWRVPRGIPIQVGYFAYAAVSWLTVACVIIGTAAAVVCAIRGTWTQRAVIALLAVPYAPLLMQIVPSLWRLITYSL